MALTVTSWLTPSAKMESVSPTWASSFSAARSLRKMSSGAQRGEVRCAAVDEVEAAGSCHARGVDAGERNRRLRLEAALVDGANRLQQERDEGFDVLVAGEALLQDRL